MKAVRLDDYNTAPVIRDIATPEIGPENVLVRVGAAALNPLDVKLQSGVLQGYFRWNSDTRWDQIFPG